MVDILLLCLDLLLRQVWSARDFHYVVELQTVLGHLTYLRYLIETLLSLMLNLFFAPRRQQQLRQIHILLSILTQIFKLVLKLLVSFRVHEVAEILIKLLKVQVVFTYLDIRLLFLSAPIWSGFVEGVHLPLLAHVEFELIAD